MFTAKGRWPCAYAAGARTSTTLTFEMPYMRITRPPHDGNQSASRIIDGAAYVQYGSSRSSCSQPICDSTESFTLR